MHDQSLTSTLRTKAPKFRKVSKALRRAAEAISDFDHEMDLINEERDSKQWSKEPLHRKPLKPEAFELSKVLDPITKTTLENKADWLDQNPASASAVRGLPPGVRPHHKSG